MPTELSRLNELLRPFTGGELPENLAAQLQIYLDLLLKWNTRMNLTSVRNPEQIITRHFGESLFAAKLLVGANVGASTVTIADVGSGAGFPGVPIHLWAPQNALTLIESQQKKATFLREVLRTLQLQTTEVFCGRAEQWGKTADIVTLRAVEEFDRVLLVAAGLVAPGGRLCVLIGEKQLSRAREIVDEPFSWVDPIAIPLSEGRVLAIAARG